MPVFLRLTGGPFGGRGIAVIAILAILAIRATNRRNQLRRSDSSWIRFTGVDIDGRSPRRRGRCPGDGRPKQRDDAWLTTKTSGRVGDKILTRGFARGRQVSYGFLNERHERRMERKIIPLSVQI